VSFAVEAPNGPDEYRHQQTSRFSDGIDSFGAERQTVSKPRSIHKSLPRIILFDARYQPAKRCKQNNPYRDSFLGKAISTGGRV
jgi:hypothetical protein